MPVRDVRFHPNSQCKNHTYRLRCSFILLSPLHCWVILLRMSLICSEKSVPLSILELHYMGPWETFFVVTSLDKGLLILLPQIFLLQHLLNSLLNCCWVQMLSASLMKKQKQHALAGRGLLSGVISPWLKWGNYLMSPQFPGTGNCSSSSTEWETFVSVGACIFTSTICVADFWHIFCLLQHWGWWCRIVAQKLFLD